MEKNLSAIFQIILKSGQMFYKNKILSFTYQEFSSFAEANIPQDWWHPKDRVVYFTYYSDGSYFCEKEKDYYDYSLKKECQRAYEYDTMSDEDAKNLFVILSSFFEEKRLEELVGQRELVRKKIEENFDLFSMQYRLHRDTLLKDSDWILLPDVSSLKSDSEIEMWKTYRQFLRDMPQSDPWLNNNYIDIVYPITPDNFVKLFPDEEYLSSPSHFESISTLVIKDSVYKLMEVLKIPSIDFNGEQIDEVKNHEEIMLFIDMINQKLAAIDPDYKIEVKLVSTDM